MLLLSSVKGEELENNTVLLTQRVKKSLNIWPNFMELKFQLKLKTKNVILDQRLSNTI